MPATPIKNCAKCGAEFQASRNDYTVNCPDCRKRRSTQAGSMSKADALYVRAGEARQAARVALDTGDKAAYDKAVADFRYFTDRRHDEMRRI